MNKQRLRWHGRWSMGLGLWWMVLFFLLHLDASEVRPLLFGMFLFMMTVNSAVGATLLLVASCVDEPGAGARQL